ncbi:MAG: hypothetical protein AB1765_11490 [Candidatus Hydrogenedentota bacterium]
MYYIQKRSLLSSLIIHLFLFFLLFQWKIVYYKNKIIGKETGEKFVFFTLEEDEPEIKKIETEGKPFNNIKPAEKIDKLKSKNEKLILNKDDLIVKAMKDINITEAEKKEEIIIPEKIQKKDAQKEEMIKEKLTQEEIKKDEEQINVNRLVIEDKKEEILPIHQIDTQKKKNDNILKPAEIFVPIENPVDREDMKVFDKTHSDKEESLRVKSIDEFLKEKKDRNEYTLNEFEKLDKEDENEFDFAQFRGITLSNYGWDWEPYLRNLRRHIKFHWYPPEAFRTYGLCSGNTIIRFSMDKKGNMIEWKLLHKEGGGDSYAIAQMHQSSIDAILTSDPFPQLPEDFPDKKLEITVGFYYLKYEESR